MRGQMGQAFNVAFWDDQMGGTRLGTAISNLPVMFQSIY